jgi:hypothetical protein
LKRFADLNQKKKTLVIVFGASFSILAALTPVLLYANGKSHELKQDFHAYGDLLIAKNYHAAYQSTGPDFRNAISEQDFITQQISLCSHNGALKDISVWSSEIDITETTLSATLTAHYKYERSSEIFNISMERWDDHWRLFGYKEE